MAFAVKEFNARETLYEIVAYLLIFGIQSRMNVHAGELHDQRRCMTVLNFARDETTKPIDITRYSTALRRSDTSAADSDVRVGDTVLV